MNKTIEYPVTKGLSVLITVEQNPLGLNPASLFRMAARINKKRSFLFVSPVLGKHLPVNPSIPLMIGRVLALIYGNQLEGHQQRLKDVLNDPEKQRDLQFDQEGLPLVEWARPLTVIGFCETATALGQAFFESFSSPVKYIHTTREDIVALVPVVSFEEEHSHATAHRVYAEDPVFFSDDSEVVLVDDEVTTGKTNLNIIRDLVRAYPHKKQFTIVSILDWRNEKNQQAYAQLEQELGVQVRAISLLKGQVSEIGQPESLTETSVVDQQKLPLPLIDAAWSDTMIDWPEQPQQRPLIGGNPAAGPAYLRTTGRFGLAATNQSDQLAKALGCQLRDIRQPGACLILGSGEFMYLPMRTASFMGQEVFFHTTTRSPILSQSRDDYPIFNKRSFPSVEQPDVPNYVYGIPNDRDYRDIFVLFERVVSDENLNELNRVLADIQGIRLYFVDVVGQRMYQAREGKEKK